MNKGVLRGVSRASRERQLIYVPFASYSSIKEGETHTADLNVTYTPPILDLDDHVAPGRNLPPGGTLRALDVMMWVRNDTSVGVALLYAHHYGCPAKIGDVEPGDCWGLYGGFVTTDYANMRAMVFTGGKGNTQFKYSVGWSVGTTVIYLRALGAWYEVS